MVSLVISWPLMRVLIVLSHRHALLDRPGSEAHKELKPAVPNVGGVAVIAAVVGPAVAGLIGCAVLEAAGRGSALTTAVASVDHRAWGLIGATLLLHAVGLLDDRRALGALPKLAAQGVAATLVIWLVGSRAMEVAGAPLSVALTVLWIVAITNAFNFLDNMDGLSTGVAAVIAAVFLLCAAAAGQWLVATLAGALLGALLGFLWFNLPPARAYLGDGGSLVIGLLLSVVALEMTYHVAPGAETTPPAGAPAALSRDTRWHAVLMPLVVFAVPLYDLVSVTLIRLREGRSPMTGDRNHFSHRLVKLGLSRPAAVTVIWLATLATAAGGLVIARVEADAAALVAVQVAAVLATLAVLEIGGHRARARR